MGCLYRLTFPNGKTYIGVTKMTAAARFTQHAKAATKQRKGSLLSKAIIEFGAESVAVQTLVIADEGPYLKDLEIRAIKAFGTLKPSGLNSTTGGDGVFDPTGESESRRRGILREINARPEQKELHRRLQKDVWTPERKALRAEEIRLKWSDPEYRAKMMRAPQRSVEGLKKVRATYWEMPGVRDIAATKMKARMKAIYADPIRGPAMVEKKVASMRAGLIEKLRVNQFELLPLEKDQDKE